MKMTRLVIAVILIGSTLTSNGIAGTNASPETTRPRMKWNRHPGGEDALEQGW